MELIGKISDKKLLLQCIPAKRSYPDSISGELGTRTPISPAYGGVLTNLDELTEFGHR